MKGTAAALGLALAFACAAAHAHIVLDTRSAVAGSYFKVTFAVGHGCSGAATTEIDITIPDGVIMAKPQPKPGWRVSTTNTALPAPVDFHGKTLRERVQHVVWTGGSLPEEQYDEFVTFVKLPDLAPGAKSMRLAFPVSQRCGSVKVDWADLPDASKPRSSTPAPVLELRPAAPEHQH